METVEIGTKIAFVTGPGEFPVAGLYGQSGKVVDIKTSRFGTQHEVLCEDGSKRWFMRLTTTGIGAYLLQELDKIKIKSVELLWSENGTLTRPETFRTLSGADCKLYAMAYTAPKDGCYDKTDFRITFEDGEIYEGRYDLKHITVQQEHSGIGVSIGRHVREFLEFYAGTRCPGHMTQEKYEAFIATEKDQQQECIDYLERYEIQ